MENRTRFTKKHVRSAEKRNSGSPAVTAFVVILSIGLMALIIYLSPLGELLQKHVIEPVASAIRFGGADERIEDALKSQEGVTATAYASPSPSAASTEKSRLTVQEIPFYILQMGAYFDKESAEEHAAQLQTMGAGGVVLADGSVFRVLAAAYQDEESLMQVQTQVRADGYEATPYITGKNSVTITLEGNPEALKKAQEAIALLSDIPVELSKMCLTFDRKQISSEDVFDQLENITEQAQIVLDSFANVQNDTLQPILTVVQEYRNCISTFIRERDTISVSEISGALKYLQINTITDYIRFFDQK